MAYRGLKQVFYKAGHGEGEDAATNTDWEKGEMAEAFEHDRLGEIVGQILENWQQMAGTIYYEDDVTDEQLDAWEEGFYEGFVEKVEEILGKP